ncbi:DNA-binding transcriptional LysR family regulator [Sporomusaceae bacterium BoRhaA]|uniref:LysR family transcriptional regulator n=1 Tax=Pelorhabdus rhamnosifermentans TaxID=2772457 RepID=UPI001C0629A4|nr:LysR family transcriptional regulator [Pelorhabdus rhamnosifermentans]MBU2702726.1 DNA-binding transcriptional LysR family regulator [Pelorhabdus rhamnosifermentans]
MDIRHLITFQTIARLASFTKASEELSYSQSTLTIHIQAIERELNGKVFERIGKNIIITELGKELLSIADVILTAHKKIEMLKKAEFLNESAIKIGAQESVAVYRLQSIINRFQQDNPQVKIIQVLGQKAELTSKLLSSEIDVMCVMQPQQENDNLIAIELAKEKMGIVGTYSQLQMLDDLENQSTVFIYPKSDCSYRKTFDNYLGKYLGNRRNIIEALSIEAIKQSIVINSGISVLPYSTVEIEVASGKMSFFELDLSRDDEVSTQLVYHKNKWFFPLLREFTDYLVHEMSMS